MTEQSHIVGLIIIGLIIIIMTDKTSLKILFSCKNLDWALSVLQVEDIFIISKEIDINKEEEEEEVEEDEEEGGKEQKEKSKNHSQRFGK